MPQRTRLRQSIINGLIVDAPLGADCDTFSCAYIDPDVPTEEATRNLTLISDTNPDESCLASWEDIANVQITVGLVAPMPARTYRVIATDGTTQAEATITDTISQVFTSADFTPALDTLDDAATISFYVVNDFDEVVGPAVSALCPAEPTVIPAEAGVVYTMGLGIAPDYTLECTQTIADLDTLEVTVEIINPEVGHTYEIHATGEGGGGTVAVSTPFTSVANKAQDEFTPTLDTMSPPIIFSIYDAGTAAQIFASAVAPCTDGSVQVLGLPTATRDLFFTNDNNPAQTPCVASMEDLAGLHVHAVIDGYDASHMYAIQAVDSAATPAYLVLPAGATHDLEDADFTPNLSSMVAPISFFMYDATTDTLLDAMVGATCPAAPVINPNG